MKIIHLLIIGAILLAAGCSNESTIHLKTPSARIGFAIREGNRLFSQYCNPCHGENADGMGKYLGYAVEPKPPDFTTPDFLQDRSDEILASVIRDGSVALGKSNLCPSWGNTFHDKEIEFLVNYIKNINERANNNDDVDMEQEQNDEN